VQLPVALPPIAGGVVSGMAKQGRITSAKPLCVSGWFKDSVLGIAKVGLLISSALRRSLTGTQSYLYLLEGILCKIQIVLPHNLHAGRPILMRCPRQAGNRDRNRLFALIDFIYPHFVLSLFPFLNSTARLLHKSSGAHDLNLRRSMPMALSVRRVFFQ